MRPPSCPASRRWPSLRRPACAWLMCFVLIGMACQPEPPLSSSIETVDAMNRPASPSDALASTLPAEGGQLVILHDRGLRMRRGTQEIPPGWQLEQDVATDPSTGQAARYRLDYSGPRGQRISVLGISSYGQMPGTSFEQMWRQMVQQGLYSEVSGVSLGALGRSTALERLRDFQQAVQMGRQRGMDVQGLEAPLRATVGGQRVEGVVFVMNFALSQFPGTGTMQVAVLFSPEGHLAETIHLHEQIANSFRSDPQYEQHRQQIAQAAMQRQQARHDQWMAHSQAMHAQRMASNRAAFASHQQMMQDRYTTNDRINAQWLDNFRGSPSGYAGGSGYTSHEAYVDGIYERSTFQDPYSGQQVHRDGPFDYWYTNGLGGFHGTNDPNFDPYSLGSNWQRIEPLRPDY